MIDSFRFYKKDNHERVNDRMWAYVYLKLTSFHGIGSCLKCKDLIPNSFLFEIKNLHS